MRDAIDQRIQSGLNAIYFEKETPILRTLRLELEAYLKGDREQFSCAIKMVGSPFQLSVWNALQAIPYGTTISYLELAQHLWQ